ncbi:MAG: phospholipase D family protein [Porticoccaceae bacterium]
MCVNLLVGCASLPPLDGRSISTALTDGEARDTPLGRALAPRVDAHPGKSGIASLSDPFDAFAARILLTRAAERTLDIQSYIWHGDTTGTLMLKAVLAAAERGVRVRLLLDDNGTNGLDAELAVLDQHANIEVRLFNPFVIRSPKPIGYITDFSRANRRMHNKSFTADNQATIIGGRNIGDEYFGATKDMLFADLDVLGVGPVVADVSGDFDRYWSSASAYPVSAVLPLVEPGEAARLNATITEADPAAASYLLAVRQSAFIRDLLAGQLALEWADVTMVSDDPAKGLGKIGKPGLLMHQLGVIIGAPQATVELVSPYFVPTATGVEFFTRMAREGVRIQIFTNSLEATDVAAVHAGYAKRRKALLEAGIRLYEMRRVSPKGKRNESAGPFGSSGSSLHAKTFAVDQARIFVGSFNFDPRSARLNTELGFVIESPALARDIEAVFEGQILEDAYEVRLDEKGKLYWLERHGDRQQRHDSEPGVGFWKRVGVSFLSILPIEWML